MIRKTTRTKTVTQEEKMIPIPIQCGRCDHTWNYRGKNEYVTSCPHCRTTVMIQKHRVPQNKQDHDNNNKNKRSSRTATLGGGNSVLQQSAMNEPVITQECDSAYG
jgi:hypothetical protein